MKKIFLNFLFLLCGIFLLVVPTSYAQNMKIAPPPYTSGTFLGESDYYSVYLRGNGEAVVSFKTNYTNMGYDSIYSVEYTIPPFLNMQNVLVYQMENNMRKPCYYPINERGLMAPEQVLTPIPSGYPAPTLNISQPCYSETYGNTFSKADYSLNDSTLTIYLPHAVSVNDQVSFFLSFRTFDFVKQSPVGVYSYAFNSLRSKNPVTSLSVGISTEQEYSLKGVNGQVNYTSISQVPLASSIAENGQPMYSQELDNYFSNIGQGSLYKYVANLAPMESYQTKGEYADSFWKLYLKEILIGFGIIIVSLIVLVVVVKKLHKKSSQSTGKYQFLNSRLSAQQQSVVLSLGLSFLSSIFISGYTVLLFFLSNFYFGPIGYNSAGIIFGILTFVVSAGLYIVFLFVPAIFVGLKRGIWWGVLTFGITILWLIFYLIIIFIFVFFLQTRSYPEPSRMM